MKPSSATGRVSIALLVALVLLPSGSHAASRVDPLLFRQWNLRNVAVPQAWRISIGRGVTVAVIDYGVRATHEDLRGQVITAVKGCKGCLDLVDQAEHGTMVASVIAAIRGNGKGIAGVAPGAKILPIGMHSGSPDPQPYSQRIRTAVRLGAKVINMSLSLQYPVLDGDYLVDKDLEPAVEEAWRRGAVIIASAGNHRLPLCGRPAIIDKVICVGAVDRRDVKTAYSNFGIGLDLVAPGGSVVGNSCNPLDPTLDENIWVTSYRTASAVGDCGVTRYSAVSGTSFAAPMVSGVAALLKARGYSNKEIVRRLTTYADDLGPPGYDPVYGWGRLNAYRALVGK